MRVAIPLLVLATSGCHMGLLGVALGASTSDGAYQEGAIARDLGPEYVRTLTCLDIGLAIHDKGADTLLDLDVGNRCIHGEPFAFDEMTIQAHDASGEDRSVYLVDPRRELVPLHVGALERGHERIRIVGLEHVAEVCFDLSGVVPDTQHARAAPLCLLRAPDGWRARSFS